MWNAKRGHLSLKKHENELLILAYSSYYKDYFHTFQVSKLSIAHSIAEIELLKKEKALNMEKVKCGHFVFDHTSVNSIINMENNL